MYRDGRLRLPRYRADRGMLLQPSGRRSSRSAPPARAQLNLYLYPWSTLALSSTHQKLQITRTGAGRKKHAPPKRRRNCSGGGYQLLAKVWHSNLLSLTLYRRSSHESLFLFLLLLLLLLLLHHPMFRMRLGREFCASALLRSCRTGIEPARFPRVRVKLLAFGASAGAGQHDLYPVRGLSEGVARMVTL